jgi:hypothetical protein
MCIKQGHIVSAGKRELARALASHAAVLADNALDLDKSSKVKQKQLQGVAIVRIQTQSRYHTFIITILGPDYGILAAIVWPDYQNYTAKRHSDCDAIGSVAA